MRRGSDDTLAELIAAGIIAMGVFFLMIVGVLIKYGIPIALVFIFLWMFGVI